MMGGYMESVLGGIVGFALAQLVHVAKFLWERHTRPKLVIDSYCENSVLEIGERHTTYGFSVRNKGLTVATGVRVQLVKMVAHHDENKHNILSENAYDLSPLRRRDTGSTSVPLTLFPGASIEIALASRNDRDDGRYEDVIFPSVSEMPHLFEEMATGATEYMYSVVVFDDKANSSQKTLSLR